MVGRRGSATSDPRSEAGALPHCATLRSLEVAEVSAPLKVPASSLIRIKAAQGCDRQVIAVKAGYDRTQLRKPPNGRKSHPVA